MGKGKVATQIRCQTASTAPACASFDSWFKRSKRTHLGSSPDPNAQGAGRHAAIQQAPPAASNQHPVWPATPLCEQQRHIISSNSQGVSQPPSVLPGTTDTSRCHQQARQQEWQKEAITRSPRGILPTPATPILTTHRDSHIDCITVRELAI